MSSNPHLDDDAFISYCHIDNRLPDDHDKGWVDNLHERLEYRLGELLGYKPKVWRDPRLPGNVYFADYLEDRIRSTAVLVCVLSPGYLQSRWCRGELQEFFHLAEQSGSLKIGDRLRIYKVIKSHVEREQHPSEFQGQLGYEFYEIDQASGRPVEFGQDLGRYRDQRYWDKLNDLAWDIKQVLVSAKPSAEASFAAPALASSKGAVYLAETTYDLRAERDKIKRELLNRGYDILPCRELPYKSPDYQEAVREDVRRSKISIHLIGGSYGIIPEGAGNSSVVRLQNEIAAERSNDSTFKRLIWLPLELQAQEETQARFIDYLKTSADTQKGAELLQTTLEELKTLIQVRLNSNGHKPLQPRGQMQPKVYLICDKRDVDGIVPLNDYLFEKGYEVMLPLIEEDGADNSQAIELHRDNLIQCDAVLIYYGNGSQAWFSYKQRDLEKIAGYERKKPLLAKAVYVAAPQTTHKQLFKTHEAVLIKSFEAFSADHLNPFITKIERAVRGADDARA
jgi:hypothetical protein